MKGVEGGYSCPRKVGTIVLTKVTDLSPRVMTVESQIQVTYRANL